jgi:transcriptional regulator with XRE-family HTH domain
MSTEQRAHTPSAIGERVRAARLCYQPTGQTQEWLACQLGRAEGSKIDPTQISAIETGKRLPSLARLCHLCAILRCSADYLLGATPPIQAPWPQREAS